MAGEDVMAMDVTPSRRRRLITLVALRHMYDRVLAVHASSAYVKGKVAFTTDARAPMLETRIWSVIGYAW
jgi:hypothetical protein